MKVSAFWATRRDPRTPPGKIIREPLVELAGISSDEMLVRMEELRDDAHYWRWLMRNLNVVLSWPIERMTPAQFRGMVREHMAKDR